MVFFSIFYGKEGVCVQKLQIAFSKFTHKFLPQIRCSFYNSWLFWNVAAFSFQITLPELFFVGAREHLVIWKFVWWNFHTDVLFWKSNHAGHNPIMMIYFDQIDLNLPALSHQAGRHHLKLQLWHQPWYNGHSLAGLSKVSQTFLLCLCFFLPFFFKFFFILRDEFINLKMCSSIKLPKSTDELPFRR